MSNEKTEKLILIVDDFKDIKDVYAHFLEQEGFRVALANDGQEALDKADELQPDLILIDLSLPGIGGWAATQRLKKKRENQAHPGCHFNGSEFRRCRNGHQGTL